MEARIDKMQQYSKYRLRCDRDERINQIISELTKITVNEYKVRQD